MLSSFVTDGPPAELERFLPPPPAASGGVAYHRALEKGVDVRPLLFETYGGWSPEVVELFTELANERSNKLDKHEYDQATWATRTWLSWVVQKVSVALHHAAALEVAHALGLSAAVDERA